jgi:hypothetical protein
VRDRGHAALAEGLDLLAGDSADVEIGAGFADVAAVGGGDDGAVVGCLRTRFGFGEATAWARRGGGF